MPIWTSPLFSDIRNALEKNIVFSKWKGRPYFRTYAIPAQPRTKPQVAVRNVFRHIVRRYQGFIKVDPTFKRMWDEIGTERMISGFNIFTSFGQGSGITATTPGHGQIGITYDTNIPLGNAAIYRETGGVITLEQMLTLAKGTITLTNIPHGTHNLFIGYRFTATETPSNCNLVTMWNNDPLTGKAVPATVTL